MPLAGKDLAMLNYEIRKGFLYIDNMRARFKQTPNGGATINPIGIINHHTASGDKSAVGDINWLLNPNAKASAHFVIDYDGVITQLMSCNLKTWHAGRSSLHGKSGLNKYTIGIELDNPGPLTKRMDGKFDGIGGPYDPSQVIEATSSAHGNNKYWKRFSNEQIEACIQLNLAITEAYSMKPQWVTTHYEVSPGRKIDPGPHFPIERIRGLIEGRDSDGGDGLTDNITAADLGIRAAPNGNFPPKPDGTSWDQNKTIFRGQSGPAIKKLQERLTVLGYHVDMDANFGARTEDAVITFQRHARLIPDGKVGRLTRVALAAAIPLPVNKKSVGKIIVESRTAKIGLLSKLSGIGILLRETWETINVDTAVIELKKFDTTVSEVKQLGVYETLENLGADNTPLAIGAVLLAIGAYLLYIRIEATRKRKIG